MFQKRNYIFFAFSVFFIGSSSDTSSSWSLFTPSNFLNSTTSNLQAYARQKLSTLRYLRNKLNDYGKNGNVQFQQKSVIATTTSGKRDVVTTTVNPKALAKKYSSSITPLIKPSRREESIGSIFKNMDNIISFTAGPLRKMISSKQGIESFASMVMPKRDVLQKLLEIKGHLEPSLKRYLTDKYNGFLSSLIPYSENIGIPPFALNSMKIPQDFDPRWQFIESLLESQGGIEKFLHTVVNGKFNLGKRPEVIQSRSGDETELISDQEPDASGQGYRKQQQQLYLSSFKRRLMKPSGGNVRFMQQNGIRPASSIDYDGLLDQTGQYGHVSYDMRAPEEMMSESYYNDANAAAEMDNMAMSASGHGGRGHGHGGGGGYGHGQPSYGGFLDPFTILGGLAFLTYLGLMLQNSLNRNNGTIGRSYNEERILPVVPITLKSLVKSQPPRIGSVHQRRDGRSLDIFQSQLVKPAPPITVSQVLNDITKIWEEIEELNEATEKMLDRNCARLKQCKLVGKMRAMNLEPFFASKLKASSDDPLFLNHVLRGELRNLCEPFQSRNCK